MARILLAESAISKHLLRAALVGYELLEANTFPQAQRLVLEDGIDMFVICVLFDDSRAMELLTLIRTDAKHKQTPILVTRVAASKIPIFIRHNMNSLKALHIISDYLEIEGDLVAAEKIQTAVVAHLEEKKLLTGKRKSQVFV